MSLARRALAPILTLALTACPAAADRIKAWQGASDVVTARDMGQHTAHTKREGYVERWRVVLFRDDGGWMQLSWVMTNVGPGDGHAGIDVMRLGPGLGSKDGKLSFYRWPKRIRRNIKIAPDKLDVTIGDNTLTRRGSSLVGRTRVWGYELEFTLRPSGPAWKAGSGRVQFPGGGELSTHLLTAVARFEGRERTHKGEWRKVTGLAWADHGSTNLLPHKLAERLLTIHGFDKGGVALHFFELFTPKNWDRERFGFLVVTRGGKVLATSRKARARPIKWRRDGRHRVPTAYRITGPTADGPVKVEVRATGRLYREDVLDPVPKLIRKFIEMFVQPVNFYDRIRFEAQLPSGGPVSGRTGMVVYGPMRAGL